MLRLLLIAAIAAGDGHAPRFGFTSSYTDITSMVYEKRENEVCPGYDILVHKSAKEEVREQQCYNKCANSDGSNPECEGFDADNQDSPSVCLFEEECQELCWMLDECVGIEMHVSKPRCYLNLWECAGMIAQGTLSHSDDYHMQIKQVPWHSACPLGLSVEVASGVYGVDGTYLEDTAGVYTKTDGNARVFWDGCQWDIQKSIPLNTTDDDDAERCHNDIAAANFLFGLVNETYNDAICDIGDVAGYCANSIFKGVCPHSCNLDVLTCNGDNHEAASALAQALGQDAVGCAFCGVQGAGTDPVVQSLCNVTCGRIDDDDSYSSYSDSSYSDTRRLSQEEFDDAFAFGALHFDNYDAEYEAERSRARKLADNGWVPFFWTDFPSVGMKPVCDAKTADADSLTDHTICDAWKFEQQLQGLRMETICPNQPCWESIHEGQIIPLTNVARDLVTDHLCVNKCGPGKDGTYCDGHDELFLPDSDALCLPRSECERVCTELGAACLSIDMHKSRNRCYLNGAEKVWTGSAESDAPDADDSDSTDGDVHGSYLQADAEYNLITKVMSSFCFTTENDVYCETQNIAPADMPVELAQHQCIGAGPLGKCNPFGPGCGLHPSQCHCEGAFGLHPDEPADSFALCLPRDECEAACEAQADCTSFDMHQTLPRCYLNSGSTSCAKMDDSNYELATKVMPLPCYPQVIREEMHSDGAYGSLMDGYKGHYKGGTGLDGEAANIGSGVFTKNGNAVKWDGCAWDLYAGDELKFSSAPATHGECTDPLPVPPMHTLPLDANLYFAFCPPRAQMTMDRICADLSHCPVLTRCVVNTARMNVELEATRMMGRQDTGLYEQQAECGAWIHNRASFVANQLAAPNRAEYHVDIESYGPESFHNHAVYRDEPTAPAVEFVTFGTATQASVTLASVAMCEEQLGRAYNMMDIQAGFSSWVTDVIRVETFKPGCAPAGGNVEFNFIAHVPHVKVFSYDSKSGAASSHAVTTTAVDCDTCAPGEYMFHVVASVPEATDFIGAADIDECAAGTHSCDANAACTNTVGSYTCACNEGYANSGAAKMGECRQIEYQCPTFKLRVSNADAIDFGWRLRELRVYTDEHCEEEVVSPGTASLYSLTDESKCGGAEINAFNHAREIVRALQCHTKCGTGTYRGARKLTRQRRMQVAGADWSNCAGHDAGLDGGSTEGSNALCASQATCESVCNELGSECEGFTMTASQRCVLHSGCTAAASAGSTAAAKGYKVTINSSPAANLHPNELVWDGHGTEPDADDYTNTEWWSKCYDCGVNDAWVEVEIKLPDSQRCQVHGVRLWQDDQHDSKRINVQVGTTTDAVAPDVGTRNDPMRKEPDMQAPYYSTFQYGGERATGCMPLLCGQHEVLHQGSTVVAAIEHVDSPCLCKQLCLENIANGCSVWGLYHEKDTNWSPEVDADHTHAICYLMGGDIVASSPQPAWITGTVDTVLTSFTPEEEVFDKEFVLTVNGLHMPDSTASRVKIVREGEGCGAEASETVQGVGCVGDICSPQPTSHTKGSATWSGVSIASASESANYHVCFCAGPCYAAWQYTAVPGLLHVEGTGFSWEYAGAAKDATSLTRELAGAILEIKVSRPPFHHSLSNNDDWELKLVSADQDCSAASGFTLDSKALPPGAFPANYNDVTYSFTLDPMDDDHTGKFLVCLSEEEIDGARTHVAMASATSRFVDLGLTEGDLEPPTGLYRNQHFSAHVGTTTIELEGHEVDSLGSEQLWLEAGACGANFGPPTSLIADAAAVSKVTFNDVPIAAAGRFKICTDSAGEVGDITVTERADIGWTYVLDPKTGGSLEVTGDNLDWKRDRMMVVDCKSTCGVSGPSPDVHFEKMDTDGRRLMGHASDHEAPGTPPKKAFTVKDANTYIAQNNYFDMHETAADNVDLPSELRTYSAVVNAYCRGNDMDAAQLGDAWTEHQCHNKCSGENPPAGCSGYSATYDDAETQALCMSEEACTELCTNLADCYGIDMHINSDRCYLNVAGAGTADGCESQFHQATLGPSLSYRFLAKELSAGGLRTVDGSGLSWSEVLRFSDVSGDGGKYKVCFCDSSLLPEGQQHCLSESDYDIEVGSLVVSGVSCLLAEEDFRRSQCYPMWHGGLACSDGIEYPTQAQPAPEDLVLPTSLGLY